MSRKEGGREGGREGGTYHGNGLDGLSGEFAQDVGRHGLAEEGGHGACGGREGGKVR